MNFEKNKKNPLFKKKAKYMELLEEKQISHGKRKREYVRIFVTKDKNRFGEPAKISITKHEYI